jgi:hypothetical protein
MWRQAPECHRGVLRSPGLTQGRGLADTDGLPYDATSPVISAEGPAVYLTVAQYEPTGGPHWNRLPDDPAHGGQSRVLFELRFQPGGGTRRGSISPPREPPAPALP